MGHCLARPPFIGPRTYETWYLVASRHQELPWQHAEHVHNRLSDRRAAVRAGLAPALLAVPGWTPRDAGHERYLRRDWRPDGAADLLQRLVAPGDDHAHHRRRGGRDLFHRQRWLHGRAVRRG